jgi:excisionase family DNA binding protein
VKRDNEFGFPPEALTPEQACYALGGISKSELYKRINAGLIRSVKLGPQITRIPYSEVQAYLKRLMAEQHPSATDAA